MVSSKTRSFPVWTSSNMPLTFLHMSAFFATVASSPCRLRISAFGVLVASPPFPICLNRKAAGGQMLAPHR